METNIFIAEKIKVGYQKRDDTYSKKLAYVIYYDAKGVLRKENSWESWRDKKIPSNEFENKPLEGFVLNKGVGGARQSYGWNARNEYIRIFDPRGFEIEISIANLLFILQETNSVKGKGLEGEFVYGWAGKDLILLPVSCQEYKECVSFTKLQDNKVSSKDYIIGATYLDKSNHEVVYLGRFEYNANLGWSEKITVSKKHLFSLKDRALKNETNYISANPTNISKLIDDSPISNYAKLISLVLKTNACSKVIGFELGTKKVESYSYGSYYSSNRTMRTYIDEKNYVMGSNNTNSHFTLCENGNIVETKLIGDYNFRKFSDEIHLKLSNGNKIKKH